MSAEVPARTDFPVPATAISFVSSATCSAVGGSSGTSAGSSSLSGGMFAFASMICGAGASQAVWGTRLLQYVTVLSVCSSKDS